MTMPFGFGRGHIGRVLLKYSTDDLKKELLLQPRSGCGYEVMAYNIHINMVKSILKHRGT